MSTRTTESSVTFTRPFTLTALEGLYPAGTYRLVTDEEQILGVSFVAFQRIATMLHVPALSVTSRARQVVTVDPTELASALEADSQIPPS
ncbi:hypothetical protein [Zavarzinia sp.]|uniref:hypothetical protein n=1 Tax=Zavarzinia sp. TaxID=2027920 RepID=UPI00356201CF